MPNVSRLYLPQLMVLIDFGPHQAQLDITRVLEILDWEPRRMMIGGPDWPITLHPPREPG